MTIAIRTILIILLAVSVTSCMNRPSQPPATGKRDTAKMTSTDGYARKNSLIAKLSNAGVQVVQVGDNVTVVLPTDRCFEQDTASIEESCMPILYDITTLLKSYGNVAITVTGYTDNVASPEQNQRFSRLQADSIVGYLWTHGIPFQRLYAEGRGADCNIAGNETLGGSTLNRRIEIALRQGF